MHIDFHKLWELADGFEENALIVKSVADISGDESRRLRTGEWLPTEPVAFTHHTGALVKDLIGTTRVERYLLSERIIHLLRSEKFTGWSTYPVQALRKGGGLLGGYHGFAVTGRSGAPDRSRSLKIQEFPRAPFVRLRGLFFDEASWDGNDIFLCGARICVTQSVRDKLDQIRATNIKFTPLDEVTSMMRKTRLSSDDSDA